MERGCRDCSHFQQINNGGGECNIDTTVWAKEKADGKSIGTYGTDEPCPMWNGRRKG